MTILGFFHPYCNAGGGGERVLYEALQWHLSHDARCLVVVYTGDFRGRVREEILNKASSRFGLASTRRGWRWCRWEAVDGGRRPRGSPGLCWANHTGRCGVGLKRCPPSSPMCLSGHYGIRLHLPRRTPVQTRYPGGSVRALPRHLNGHAPAGIGARSCHTNDATTPTHGFEARSS